MIEITFPAMTAAISVCWIFVRAALWLRCRQIRWRREAQLMLVYIALIVVARFTFFPYARLNGQIQPLIFNAAAMLPLRINVRPFVHLMDYILFRSAMINLIGNIAMFIPIGVIWPIVFRQLRSPLKAIAAGVGFSLCIEILQLPFCDRVSDIDDLILNSTGYLIGYALYLLTGTCRKKRASAIRHTP